MKREVEERFPDDSPETDHEISEPCVHIMPEETSEDISNLLYDFTASLDTACKKAEPNFMHLGQKLESIYLDAAALTEQTLGAVRLISVESDESILVRVERLAKESVAELNNCQTRVAADLSLVNTVIGYLSDLSCICDVIEKIAMSLRVVGFNISLESSRSKKSSDMFTVVFKEIYRLSAKIVKISDDIRGNVGATRVSQLSVHSKISEALDQLHTLSNDAQQAVEDSAREIRQLMELSRKALETAGAHSREISLQVGEIVAGIQIHDSMSQRAAHISNALHDVTRLYTQETSEMTDAEKAGVAYAISEIQCAQLRQTIAEVDGVDEKSRTAFKKIHSEVDRLTRSVSIFGMSEAEAGSVPLFSELQSALSHLSQIIDQGTRLTDQIQGTAAEATETAGMLEGYMKLVQEISFETHLVSLNAIVKAAHLGGIGRSLEILAQEVKVLSDQSNEFVEDVTEILEAISASVREIRKIPSVPPSERMTEDEQFSLEKERETEQTILTFPSDAPAGQTDPAGSDSVLPNRTEPLTLESWETEQFALEERECGEQTFFTERDPPLKERGDQFSLAEEFKSGVSLDVGIHEITRAYEQFRTNSSSASERAEALKDSILQTISELGFFSDMSGELGRYLHQLERIVRMLASRADKDIKKSAAETDRLLERYTMQQERDIHDRLTVREDLLNGSEEEIGEKEDDGEENFGDNVELF